MLTHASLAREHTEMTALRTDAPVEASAAASSSATMYADTCTYTPLNKKYTSL